MKLKYVCFCVKSIKHVRLSLKLYRITPGKDENFRVSIHFSHVEHCGARIWSFLLEKYQWVTYFKQAVCFEEQKNNGAH